MSVCKDYITGAFGFLASECLDPLQQSYLRYFRERVRIHTSYCMTSHLPHYGRISFQTINVAFSLLWCLIYFIYNITNVDLRMTGVGRHLLPLCCAADALGRSFHVATPAASKCVSQEHQLTWL